MLGFTTTDQVGELTDEEILARSVREPWLFAVLLERYQEPFLRKAKGIIHSPEDAEEIVQDTFTKIYLNAAKFSPVEGASFSSWGYRILMNTAFTLYQKRLKEGKRFVNIDPDFEKLLGERGNHSAFEEDRDMVERVLKKLPNHLAAVLRLHYLERWSHQDIASQNDETVSTIKARVHRAKAAFKKEWPGNI
ncbi:MAG: RNA polymerase sigma factor [Candidatus Paceibacterota bacterium]